MFLVIPESVPSFVVAALSQLSLVSKHSGGDTVLPVAGWGFDVHAGHPRWSWA